MLRADVETLGAAIGERHILRYDALVRAAAWIKQSLTAAGYQPHGLPFDCCGRAVENVEATLAGGVRAREVVLVGAHYDTVPGCPGANDNGSGVAAMLELGRRLAGTPHDRTVRFVAFVNEEPPFFQSSEMGSLVYATSARRRGDRIVGMLSLETIGYYSDEPGSQTYPAPLHLLYPTRGNFIAFVANFASAGLLRRALRAFRRGTPFPVQGAAAPVVLPGVGWSDHWAFWRAGYRALMVTDTAPYRYPWYHTPDDTPDKVDYGRLTKVVDGLEHVVRTLAHV
jgi:Zn-dependent M28 family amino/carboxypeptidase